MAEIDLNALRKNLININLLNDSYKHCIGWAVSELLRGVEDLDVCLLASSNENDKDEIRSYIRNILGDNFIISEAELQETAGLLIIDSGNKYFNNEITIIDIESIIPKFCINGPNNLGLHCIAGPEGSSERCPHFAFGRARSTIIVTDEKGQDFACNGFYVEDALRLSEKEYLKKEKEWITNWSEKIRKSTFDDNEDLRDYYYEVWIEKENCVDKDNDISQGNTDVMVKFEDGTRFWATFFTYDNINCLRQKNIKSGECLGGKYFWSSDLILVDEINRARIEEVIEHLIRTREFAEVFRCYSINE